MKLARSFGISWVFKSQLYFYILTTINWKILNVNDIICHNIKRNQIPRNKSNKMRKTSLYRKLQNVTERNYRRPS